MTQPNPYTPTVSPKHNRWPLVGVAALVVAVVVLAILNVVNVGHANKWRDVAMRPALSSVVTLTQTVTEQAAPAAAPAAPAPAAPSAGFPDGAYLIGSEMPAGNYTAAGGRSTCVWLIYDSAHQPTASGFGRIATLPASGYNFESVGCGTWTSTG